MSEAFDAEKCRAQLKAAVGKAIAAIEALPVPKVRVLLYHKMLGTEGNGGLDQPAVLFCCEPPVLPPHTNPGATGGQRRRDQRRVGAHGTAGDGGLAGSAKPLE